MTKSFTAGDLTIHRIIEQETTFLPALDMLPGLTPELLAENRAWMQKAGAIDASDVLILCFQSYIVKTPHHTILVDSCIGNDKPRPLRPKWNMKTDDTYMKALAAAGFSVGDIDFVMCTHLHVDHVGWNTRLENGRWVPTFPNARYVFGKTEFDYWTEQHAKTEVPPFADSVLPIVEANKGEIVRDDYAIGDHVRILPDAGSYARACRVHLRPRQGRRRGQRRPDAFTAAGALSRTVSQIRCRPGRCGGDAARLPGTLLRHRHAVLHRAFSLALDRQNPPRGQRICLRGGELKSGSRAWNARAASAMSPLPEGEVASILRAGEGLRSIVGPYPSAGSLKRSDLSRWERWGRADWMNLSRTGSACGSPPRPRSPAS